MSEITGNEQEFIDSERFSENEEGINREEQAARLLRFLDKLHADQVFDTAKHKLEFIQNLTYEEFTNFLLHINGIVRDIPTSERQLFQQVRMAVPTGGLAELAALAPSDMPPLEDKPELLKATFDKIKELENPCDIGLIMAAALNAIHVFEDGNGRTSRLVYDLMNYNYTGQQRDQKFLMAALGEEGRFTTPDADPTMLLYGAGINLIIKNDLIKFEDADYYYFDGGTDKDIEARQDLSDEQREKLQYLKSRAGNDRIAVFLSISVILKHEGRVADYVTHFVNKEEGINRAPLDREKVIKQSAGEDIEKFWQGYWGMKTAMVSEMVDSLIENRSFPNVAPFNGEAARDFARQEIADRLKHIRESWQDLAANWPEYPDET